MEYVYAVLLAVMAAALCRLAWRPIVSVVQPPTPVVHHPGQAPQSAPVAFQPVQMSYGQVQILKLTEDPTLPQIIGHRDIGHADVQEALDTPGLAVRWPTGDLDLGNQG